MHFVRREPPRAFQCGRDGWVTLNDCGTIQLEPDEVLALPTNTAFSYSIMRHSWGYLMTGPLDATLTEMGWTAVIAGESDSKLHLMLIAPGADQDFRAYCAHDGIEVRHRFAGRTTAPSRPCDWHYPQPGGDKGHVVHLAADEQVTLLGESGSEFDVTRKAWGFYGSPSFRWRMPRFNVRPALIGNKDAVRYFCVVEAGHEAEFEASLDAAALVLYVWCDQPDALQSLAMIG